MIYYEKNSVSFSTVYLTYQSGLVSAKAVRDEMYQSTEDAFNENREYYLGLKDLKDFDLTDKEQLEQYKKLTAKPPIQPKNEVDFECIFHYIKELHYHGGNFAGTQYSINGRAWEYDIGQKMSGG